MPAVLHEGNQLGVGYPTMQPNQLGPLGLLAMLKKRIIQRRAEKQLSATSGIVRPRQTTFAGKLARAITMNNISAAWEGWVLFAFVFTAYKIDQELYLQIVGHQLEKAVPPALSLVGRGGGLHVGGLLGASRRFTDTATPQNVPLRIKPCAPSPSTSE
ncbi:MAG: hypothetical protein FRX49_10399 [Trebouxia sp. A1-2]|nr:MAG: hypothetical protein FRX49_10399 [Trebouxia sp. A1-2]